jgi:hypothetical protein
MAKKVFLATRVPLSESVFRGDEVLPSERRLQNYEDILTGKEDVTLVQPQEYFLAGLRKTLGDDLQVDTSLDPPFASSLDFVPQEGYDAALLIEQLASTAVSQGYSLQQALPLQAVREVSRRYMIQGLQNVRKALNAQGDSRLYMVEFTSISSDTLLLERAFPEGSAKRSPEDAYRKILGDAGFSVEKLERSGFDRVNHVFVGSPEGDYMVIEAVPASAPKA